MFSKIGVLKNYANFTGKHLCQSILFKKVASLQTCNFIRKRLQQRCFPVKFAKFLRTPFLTKHLWWLLPNFSLTNSTAFWFLHYFMLQRFFSKLVYTWKEIIGLLNIFTNQGQKNFHIFRTCKNISVKVFLLSNSVGRICRTDFLMKKCKRCFDVFK